jgi:hypothetical protein
MMTAAGLPLWAIRSTPRVDRALQDPDAVKALLVPDDPSLLETHDSLDGRELAGS